ncbi:glutathione S-transferase omega-1-like [Rhinatrema bivittatum]|uniref:glutathione S-transferase omega-1-like n=1 Tax=Rhinatrema bivittatum TaxID=194408 RepID=UPI001127CAF1|nr:glutathione S-transferase omega-1-like [Rhinatrema bivittatum]
MSALQCWEYGAVMAAKSLREGSAAPGPVPEGLIRIYSMRFCPYAQRSRLVLAAKGIQHETINVNLINKPGWFLEKAPLGLVPVLETEKGQVIYESLITCDYLDESYPGKKLTPEDPYEKAKQKMLLEHFSKVVTLLYEVFLARKTGEGLAAFREQLLKFEQLVPGDTQFLGGDSVSMVDYMIWPWFERLAPLSMEEYLNDAPKLKKWVEAMMEDPVVKELLTSPEDHKGFMELYLARDPEDADFGL